MKHPPATVLVMILIFVAAQYIGLYIVNGYVYKGPAPTGGEVTTYTGSQGNFTVYNLPTVAGLQLERPMMSESTFIIQFVISLLVGTGILLVLVKLRTAVLWKLVFVTAAALCMSVAFGRVTIQLGLPEWTAVIVGTALALWKVLRPNVAIQNLTEPFVYAGLTAVFLPFISVWVVTILLVIMSIYDIYAVWGSKHMVSLANFSRDTKVFPGIMLPRPAQDKEHDIAVLGGGDIAFPLLFTAAVLKTYTLWNAMIIPLFTTLTLLLLLAFAKGDRYYPAIPFLTCGCMAGLVVSLLLTPFL